jgi:hypothetical protein
MGRAEAGAGFSKQVGEQSPQRQTGHGNLWVGKSPSRSN